MQDGKYLNTSPFQLGGRSILDTFSAEVYFLYGTSPSSLIDCSMAWAILATMLPRAGSGLE